MHNDEHACVSVIVPIYNAERFLDQCLESIRSQTYHNLEIICINDGSTDGSLAIMQRHAGEDKRVRIIDKENGGYGAGCNRGIAEAHGAWVSIVEPDDWIDATMYADMLAFASTFEAVPDIIKTPWWDIKFWDDPARMKAYACPLTGRIARSKKPFTLREQPVLLEHHPAIWSALYRRDFLAQHEIRFPEYPGAGWADNPFLIDTLGQAHAIVYLDCAYYRYRSDLPGSTVNHATSDAVMRPFERWLAMLEKLKALGIADRNVYESLYLRGFTYVEGAIYDDGWDNQLVREGTRRVFAAMDADIVLDSAKVSVRRKKDFCRVLGLPLRGTKNIARMRYVIRDVTCYLRIYGFGEFLERLAVRMRGDRRPGDVEG